MFIELTDHLRCPGEHEERFLVLLPDRMIGRQVVAGILGCPVCRREVTLADGTVDFGGGTPAGAPTALAPEAVAAALGLEGPGGFVALVGGAGSLAQPLARLLPGVRFALINPDRAASDDELASVIRSSPSPLKSHSMRGVVIGRDAAGDRRWVEAGVDAVLPGNRMVVEGRLPAAGPAGLEIVGEAGVLWVGRKAPPPLRR
jgi:hypothetical protein